MRHEDDFLENNNANIIPFVKQFEEMLKTGTPQYFDTDTLEDIFDYFFVETDFEKAQKAAEFGINQNPYSGVFFLKKAQVEFISGFHDLAMQNVEQALIFEPNNIEVLVLKGNIYESKGATQNAIKTYKEAIKLASKDDLHLIYMSLSNLYLNISQFEKAIHYLKICLELHPEDEQALDDLSFAFHLSDNTEAGISFFKSFIDEDPFSQMAWYHLGTLYSKEHLFEKAIEAFDYAILIDEKEIFPYLGKTNAFLNLEQFINAEICLKEALEIDPKNPMLLVHLGVCHEKMEDYGLARFCYIKASEIEPHFSDAWFGMAVCDLEEEKFQSAEKYAQKAIALNPQNADYWYCLAEARQHLGLIEDSCIAYQKSILLDPDFIDVRLEFALYLIELNNKKLALEVLNDGLELHHEKIEYLYPYLACLFKMGHQEEALIILHKALELNFEKNYLIFDFLPELLVNSKIGNIIESYKA